MRSTDKSRMCILFKNFNTNSMIPTVLNIHLRPYHSEYFSQPRELHVAKVKSSEQQKFVGKKYL